MTIKKVLYLLLVCLLFNSAIAEKPQLYIFLGGDSIQKHISQINNKQVIGVQKIYTWKTLETTKDHYNFSEIKSDIKLLKKHNKKLFIQLQDRSFNVSNIPVPEYIKIKEYDNGIIIQSDNSSGGKPSYEGWVTKQWNVNVRHRFQKLIKQLAKEFDGKIAGINLPETAIDMNPKILTTKFCDDYFNAEVSNMLYARKEFKKSLVVQYVNFWPCEWNNSHGYMQKIFKIAEKNNIGVGNPDTLPYGKNQMHNSYPFFNKYKTKVFTTIAVQEFDYDYINSKTSKKYTLSELYDFDKNYIGADIVFWTALYPQKLSYAAYLFK
ncbi:MULTISPECIES: hypothetical protein [unclassified Francisella]|uniref:hypothetical protein n=1 Tax=unclassified Francisella TaxID=2610885 RepID=UPI002E2FA47F|nr:MULTISPECIES: hypothetical protein [unclassified Francisella]MED7820378.1 hypothetical protein [Francisella sp. 19S2-4]MED7831213.1 hypothetical protein [Francisella sp. 19S2-10]